MAIVAVIPGREPNITPMHTPSNDMKICNNPNENTSIAFLLYYGRVILKTWPKKNQISSEDTTAIIREISKDLKS
jgi:hypothetical protein